jgi:O-antigen ligase
MTTVTGQSLYSFESYTSRDRFVDQVGSVSPWRNFSVLMSGVWLLLVFILMLHEPPGNAAKYVELEMGKGVDDRADFESNVNSAPTMRKVGFVALIALGGFSLITSQRRLEITNYPLLASTILLAAWTYGSIAWSHFPRETMLELIRLSGWLLVAFALARKFTANELAVIMFIVVTGAVSAAVATDILTGEFRPWRSVYRMTGTLHPNGLADNAALMAVIATFFFIKGDKRQYGWLAIIAIGFVVVALTKSRNGLMCFFVGIYVLSIIGQPIGGFLKAIAFSSVLAGLLLVASGVITESQKRSVVNSATMGRGTDAKLSGRSDLWKTMVTMTGNDRTKGVGYGAFFVTKRVERLGKALRWFPHHAHNAYIEVLANLGWVGLGLGLTTAILAFFECLKRLKLDQDIGFRLFATMIILGAVQGSLCVAYIHARGFLSLSAAIIFSSIFIASQVAERRHNPRALPLP